MAIWSFVGAKGPPLSLFFLKVHPEVLDRPDAAVEADVCVHASACIARSGTVRIEAGPFLWFQTHVWNSLSLPPGVPT